MPDRQRYAKQEEKACNVLHWTPWDLSDVPPAKRDSILTMARQL